MRRRIKLSVCRHSLFTFHISTLTCCLINHNVDPNCRLWCLEIFYMCVCVCVCVLMNLQPRHNPPPPHYENNTESRTSN